MLKDGIFTFFTESDGNYGATQRSGLHLTNREGAGPMESEVESLSGAESVDITEFIFYAGYSKNMMMPSEKNLQEGVDLATDIIEEVSEMKELRI